LRLGNSKTTSMHKRIKHYAVALSLIAFTRVDSLSAQLLSDVEAGVVSTS